MQSKLNSGLFIFLSILPASGQPELIAGWDFGGVDNISDPVVDYLAEHGKQASAARLITTGAFTSTSFQQVDEAKTAHAKIRFMAIGNRSSNQHHQFDASNSSTWGEMPTGQHSIQFTGSGYPFQLVIELKESEQVAFEYLTLHFDWLHSQSSRAPYGDFLDISYSTDAKVWTKYEPISAKSQISPNSYYLYESLGEWTSTTERKNSIYLLIDGQSDPDIRLPQDTRYIRLEHVSLASGALVAFDNIAIYGVETQKK